MEAIMLNGSYSFNEIIEKVFIGEYNRFITSLAKHLSI